MSVLSDWNTAPLETDAKTRRVRLAGNTATGLLKLIAIICMMIDHTGASLLPSFTELRIIGRIAFPLFAWSLVVGSEYSRSIPRYALRLLIFLAVSQPFYMLALNHTALQLNIFATLLLGLVGIYGIRLKKYGSQVLLPALGILASCLITVDYGWRGVVFILLLYGARRTRGGIAAVMIAFCLFWGQSSSTLTTVFGVNLSGLGRLTPYGGTLVSAVLRLQGMAILALPLMLIPMRCALRIPKWAAYAAYPAHLLLLYLIRLCL